jgi:flagellar hook assembly protein FlgD
VFDNGKPLIPTEYSLEQNFPNPFNLSTQIQYAIPEKTRGKIVIYNLLGQKVRTFDLGERAPGRYTMTWDGKNEVGTVVSSGVYFYRFETDKFKQTKKLMMLK